MRDGRVDFGPWRTDDEVDVVAEAGELAGQLGRVDALAAGVHVSLMEEEEDLHRQVRGIPDIFEVACSILE